MSRDGYARAAAAAVAGCIFKRGAPTDDCSTATVGGPNSSRSRTFRTATRTRAQVSTVAATQSNKHGAAVAERIARRTDRHGRTDGTRLVPGDYLFYSGPDFRRFSQSFSSPSVETSDGGTYPPATRTSRR